MLLLGCLLSLGNVAVHAAELPSFSFERRQLDNLFNAARVVGPDEIVGAWVSSDWNASTLTDTVQSCWDCADIAAVRFDRNMSGDMISHLIVKRQDMGPGESKIVTEQASVAERSEVLNSSRDGIAFRYTVNVPTVWVHRRYEYASLCRMLDQSKLMICKASLIRSPSVSGYLFFHPVPSREYIYKLQSANYERRSKDTPGHGIDPDNRY